jgi:hypothetical protein
VQSCSTLIIGSVIGLAFAWKVSLVGIGISFDDLIRTATNAAL